MALRAMAYEIDARALARQNMAMGGTHPFPLPKRHKIPAESIVPQSGEIGRLRALPRRRDGGIRGVTAKARQKQAFAFA